MAKMGKFFGSLISRAKNAWKESQIRGARETYTDVPGKAARDPLLLKHFDRLARGQVLDAAIKEHSITHGTLRIGIVNYNGKKYCVKRTNDPNHGADYRHLRQQFLAHQRAALGGKIRTHSYVLRSIPIEGRVGNYMVMKWIETTPLLYEPGNLVSAVDAKLLLEKNLHTVLEKEMIPQIRDSIIAGNTKPQDPKHGKWIIYLPYDYI